MKALTFKGRIDLESLNHHDLSCTFLRSNTMDFSSVIFVCSNALGLIIERLSNNLDTILSAEVIELIIKSYES